ncbi:MAG: HAMP domain-containing histidine kinase [Muribaculaceae bacterium]|nr:HAMP domain-containing histidine kinase [Muribaculaceae bacterium]
MALEKLLDTKWRLFLPRVISMTIILVGMAAWQVYRERSYRREFIVQQLEIVADRIANGYEHKQDISNFLKFVDTYFTRSQFFGHLKLAVYDYSNWKTIDSTGNPIHLSLEEKDSIKKDISSGHEYTYHNLPTLDNGNYVYIAKSSINANNGRQVIIVAALSNDNMLNEFIEKSSNEIWIIVLALALVSFTAAYISARRFSRNITLLREIATRSANENDFMPGEDFSRDELGEIARQIVTLYNARTEALDRLEREHDIAMHAMEEKALQKRQLTNNINHELKTPIGVIKGYLDILADEQLDPETQRHFIEKARNHANRLVNLMQDVSAITRLEEGQNQISTERLDFHDIAYSFANDVAESGIMGNMKFIHEIPLGCFVRGNYNLLMAVIQNLAKNAANYSRGTECHLEAHAGDDNFYYFRFWDNGVGVSREHLEHIFERFYRIDSGRARKSGGTGLGLAIVYNTIIAHHGKIKASSHPATGGFMIEFSLPKWK